MALDIHVLDRKGCPGELLHQIEFEAYQRLAPAWCLFRKRTGLFIDPYSHMAFSSGLTPLIQSLVDTRPDVQDQATRHDLETLISILTKAEKAGLPIGFFGD